MTTEKSTQSTLPILTMILESLDVSLSIKFPTSGLTRWWLFKLRHFTSHFDEFISTIQRETVELKQRFPFLRAISLIFNKNCPTRSLSIS